MKTLDSATLDYNRLISGERIVMSGKRHDRLIDECGCRCRMNELASCLNLNRCGINDEYVAWIGPENKPHDLELGAGGSLYAIGSV